MTGGNVQSVKHFGLTRMVRTDRPLWRQVLTVIGGCCWHVTHHQSECQGTWQRDWSDERTAQTGPSPVSDEQMTPCDCPTCTPVQPPHQPWHDMTLTELAEAIRREHIAASRRPYRLASGEGGGDTR